MQQCRRTIARPRCHEPEIGPDYADEHCGQNDSPASYANPSGEDEFAAALNLGSKLFDAFLKTHDLLVGIRTS
jgi:hypothetical protein